MDNKDFEKIEENDLYMISKMIKVFDDIKNKYGKLTYLKETDQMLREGLWNLSEEWVKYCYGLHDFLEEQVIYIIGLLMRIYSDLKLSEKNITPNGRKKRKIKRKMKHDKIGT